MGSLFSCFFHINFDIMHHHFMTFVTMAVGFVIQFIRWFDIIKDSTIAANASHILILMAVLPLIHPVFALECSIYLR